MTIENKYTPYAQRGFATVLIVLLVGLAVAASALGTAYYINSSQKSLVSSHALTNAQSGAWTGVEIFRKYLDILDEAGIASLNEQNLTLKVQGCPTAKAKDCAELKVSNISSIETSNNPKQYRVTASIQNISEKSEASSTIQVVYDINIDENKEENKEEKPQLSSGINALNFYTDVDVSGKVLIKQSNNNPVNINIVGNAKMNEISNIDTLKVTGDLVISNSSTKVNNIYSDGDVTINSPDKINIINTQKSITLNNGGGEVEILLSGKDIHWKNDTVLSKYAYANHNIINAARNSTLSQKPAIGDHYSIQLKAGNTINCSSNNYKSIAAISLSNCNNTTNNKILNENDLPIIDPKLLGTNLIKQPPMVNANCYDPSQGLNCETNSIYTKGDTANYVFEYIGNTIIVTVYNIIFPNNQTPTNGSKYCFKSVNNHGGYLYPAIVSGTKVTCNEKPVANLSRYYSNDDNQRIIYDKGDWTMKKNNYNIGDQIEDIKKPSFAPG